MYWCDTCGHPVEELVECSDGEPVELVGGSIVAADPSFTYRGCPYCGSEDVRDYLHDADMSERDDWI